MDQDKPQPRPPRSPAHAASIRILNRRREYLNRHPDYLRSTEHELAAPLLYDTLIRHFQTAEERERVGRANGYSRNLEVGLLRGEAKLSQLQGPPRNRQSALTDGENKHRPGNFRRREDERGPPGSRDEGRERWDDFLRLRFVDGGDDDFDYRQVDEDDSYDALGREDEEEAWFNDEEPNWEGDKENEGCPTDVPLQGETGQQDF